MIRTSTLTLALTPLLLLAGCEFGNGNRMSDWEKNQLESRASSDLDDFLADFDGFGEGLSGSAEAREEGDDYEWNACIVGYAGCQRCYTMAGIVGEGGTLSMEHVLGDEVDTCSASVTLNDVFYGYTIDSWWWDGSWAPRDDGLFDIAWNGESASTLVIEGSDRNDGEYDYSYVMNAAAGVTDGAGTLSEWSVDYAYNGFLDRSFTVVVAKDADGAIAGVITGDNVTCTVSGEGYDYVIDCV